MKLSNGLRDHLVEWLKANGVNVNDVPSEPHMTYDGRELITDVYLTTEDGKRLLAPGREDELATTTATFTVTTPPPPDVAWWLRSRCPTCGR